MGKEAKEQCRTIGLLFPFWGRLIMQREGVFRYQIYYPERQIVTVHSEILGKMRVQSSTKVLGAKLMNSSFQFFKQSPMETPLGDLVENFLLGSRSAQEWQQAREKASAILLQYTEELRQLMAKMHNFSHETSVETVMEAQTRIAALRWLVQSIEREVQRLDKAYREKAQIERLLEDRAILTTF